MCKIYGKAEGKTRICLYVIRSWTIGRASAHGLVLLHHCLRSGCWMVRCFCYLSCFRLGLAELVLRVAFSTCLLALVDILLRVRCLTVASAGTSAGHFIRLLGLFSARTAASTRLLLTPTMRCTTHCLLIPMHGLRAMLSCLICLIMNNSTNIKVEEGRGPDFSEGLRTLVFPSRGLTIKTRLPPLPAAPMLKAFMASTTTRE